MIKIPHLETDVTTACQLSCVGCNHHVPLHRKVGATMASVKQVEKDLNYLSTIVHADRWGALGGEPLLHRDLPSILDAVRASGVSDLIEVWTNGIAFQRAEASLREAEFDVLVLSRYDGKLTDQEFDFIVKWCASYDKALDLKDHRVGQPYGSNFRTLLEPKPTDAAATRAKFADCFFRHFSRVANDGYFYTCCCAPHMPVLVQGRDKGADGIAIDGLTEGRLKGYLERTEPLGACSICAGRDTAVPIQWHEEKDPVMWLKASGQCA